MTVHEIHQLCAEAGIPLREAVERDGMLILSPERLDALPSASTLRELALALRGGSIRWVTLDIEEPP